LSFLVESFAVTCAKDEEESLVNVLMMCATIRWLIG